MKTYRIIAEIDFYFPEDQGKNPISAHLISETDQESLIQALKYWDSKTNEECKILGFSDYFIIPEYIGMNGKAMSKKYYLHVAFEDDSLWRNWAV